MHVVKHMTMFCLHACPSVSTVEQEFSFRQLAVSTSELANHIQSFSSRPGRGSVPSLENDSKMNTISFAGSPDAPVKDCISCRGISWDRKG